MADLRTSTRASTPLAATAAPPATRAPTAGWRDPRLIAGVAIVAVCVLLGARVMAGADDTVPVWSLRHDVSAGSPLDAGDLQVARVRLPGDRVDRYVLGTDRLAPGTTVTRDLTAGELLPRAAVTTGAHASLVEVPLSVAPDDLPASVRQGAVVDVWVTPKVADPGGDHVRARLALEHVVVVAVPASGDSLAPRTTRQVIVGVEESRADDLADALGQLADGRVVLTREATS